MDLTPYLEDIESRIQPEQEETLQRAWFRFADGANDTGPFVPPVRVPSPSKLTWTHVHVNEALRDDDLMVLSQLEYCHRLLSTPSDVLLSMRPNYGVGILASLFGAEPFIMAYEQDCLPNVRPLAGGGQAIRALLDRPLPDFSAGFGGAVLRIARRFAEIRSQYPKISRYVFLDAPDCQSSMDICELLWGSNLFYALYDEPDTVHALLDRVTQAYKAFMEAWFSIVPQRTPYHVYLGRVVRGSVFLRDDSAMNLSPALYEEFVFPYDRELLCHFGGGGIHFCGRGEHFIPKMAATPGLTGVDMSQPHLNDMEVVLSHTIDRGIPLYCVSGDYTRGLHAYSRLRQT